MTALSWADRISTAAFTRSDCPCRLILNRRGSHKFGGPVRHDGAVPRGADVPLQLVLSLDLTDPNCPITSQCAIRRLPLYYPFKYGTGGSEIQCAVRSDSQIEILFLSETAPDDSDQQYLRVDQLPEASFDPAPLTYEEARILAFLSNDGFFPHLIRLQRHFEPNRRDRKLIEKLDLKNLTRIGRQCADIPNAPDAICRNPECERFNSCAYFKPIATIPPIPVNGKRDFWYEFQGGVLFCFGLCYFCGTVIAFNVAD
jgi:hypothetical protein